MVNGISIIIPIQMYSDGLLRLLRSIAKQDYCGTIETILIVNNPDVLAFEEVKIQLQQFKNCLENLQISLIYLDRAGVNRARNAGLEAASYPILFFFDDDCELASHVLLSLHLHQHLLYPGLFALGGIYQLPPVARLFDQVYHFIQMRWLYAGLKTEQGSATSYLIAGHYSVKKEMIDNYQIKFNDKIIYGGSELEFFLLADKKGLRMELSELAVIHRTSESFFSLNRKLYKQGVGKAISEENHPEQKYIDQANESTAWSPSSRINIFLVYYNYVFWFGYYARRGERLRFMSHLFKNLCGFVSGRKSILLSYINVQSQIKKHRGDRI